MGREVGVFDPLGKTENRGLLWCPVWDMSLVLMTQMGFVTMVLLAPAMMEDQKLTTKLLSIF